MFDQFLPHHRSTMEQTTAHYQADSRYLALIIGGSLIKGYGRPDSDVDIMIITTDEEYARLQEKREFTLYRPDLSTYEGEGAYVDGKFLNLQFLKDAAERGSEPTRWSFQKSIIAFNKIPELETLIGKITQYPLHEQEAKIRSFYGQFIIFNWFVGEAEKRQNTYLMAQASANLVLYGSRLILAHNRMLYPYHKWMMAELQRAPDKPEGLIETIDALLKAPSVETAKAFHTCVNEFRDWGVSFEEGINAFAEASERSWLHGRPAMSDW